MTDFIRFTGEDLEVVTNYDEPEREPGGGPMPMPEPPKFLDKLLSEMEQGGELAPGSREEPPPRAFAPPPPLEARRAQGETPRRNTLLVVALVAALLVNLALVFMMFTVLRDRSAERPVVVEDIAGREATGDTSSIVESRETELVPDDEVPLDEGVLTPAEAPVEEFLPEVIVPFGISKLALCREIRGFAEYDPIPDAPLLPHHVPQIQAYIEVANPRPEPREDGRYVYYLSVATRLYPTGDPFADPLIDKVISLVVNGTSPREDFHAAQPLQVSRRVGPGDYTLLVRVTDQISGETARQETGLRVQASQP
jgi:hypothetical protein